MLVSAKETSRKSAVLVKDATGGVRAEVVDTTIVALDDRPVLFNSLIWILYSVSTVKFVSVIAVAAVGTV